MGNYFLFSQGVEKNGGCGLRYVPAKKPTLLEKVGDSCEPREKVLERLIDSLGAHAAAVQRDTSGAEHSVAVCEVHCEP